MAANTNLVVRISAVDATADAINAVTRRLAGVTAPVTKVTKSLARLSDATGVTKLSNAVLRLGGSAVKAADSLAPLSALTAALSLGGIAKMTSDWAKFSQGMGFDATRIGVGVSQLHALEGSAALAGSSAEAAGSGLRTLQDTMTDVVGGRNMEALVYFRQLGVAFDDGAGHALRATEVLPKLADAIAKIKDPSLQARVATQFFGGAAEDLLPWLRRGSAGIAEYAEMARHYGVETEETTEKARGFELAQSRLTLAIKGFGRSISEQVSPPLAELMTFMSELIGRNRTMIAEKFGRWAKQFRDWVEGIDWEVVGSRIERIATAIGSITESLSRGELGEAWRKLLKLMGANSDAPTTPGGLIPRPDNPAGESRMPTLSPGQHTEVGRKAMGIFEDRGWSHDDAAAILSGVDRESGLRPDAQGDRDPKTGAYMAYGAAQWHIDRQAQFNDWSSKGGTDDGHDIRHSSLEEQMRFIDWDLTQGKYKSVGDHMKAAKTRDEKMAIFDREYESPADIPGAIAQDAPRAAQWAAQPSSKHEVTIRVQAPTGTQVETRSDGTGPATVRVERAMR